MPTTREEESRLQVRTLLIASAASLAAALITARIWVAGTPIAAAVTPVIVAVVSELLHRPTDVIARRVTSDRTAVLPPPSDAQTRGQERSEVRVYRSEPDGRRRIHLGVVLATAVLAFAIAAAALTLPELLAGQSIGKAERKTTLFGGRDRDDGPANEPAPVQTAPQDEPADDPPPATEPEESPPADEPPTTTEEPPLTLPTNPENAIPPPE